MTIKVSAGDVAFSIFPKEESEGFIKPHPVLILSTDITHPRYEGKVVMAAFGSSKKVSASGHLPTEFVLSTDKELNEAGLEVPTRFDMARVRFIQEKWVKKTTGIIDVDNDDRLQDRLARAIKHAKRQGKLQT